jgi:hypothetical protein
MILYNNFYYYTRYIPRYRISTRKGYKIYWLQTVLILYKLTLLNTEEKDGYNKD